MAVTTVTTGRFLAFARWYLTPVGSVYTAVVVAGLVLALADRLPAAVLILTAGLLVVLPWKLSFQESSRVTLVSQQHVLASQAAQVNDQVAALKNQLAETTNQTTQLKNQLAETTNQTTQLKNQLAETKAAMEAEVHKARTEALVALDGARGEWGMLLRAEREQFASQLRQHAGE
jgi:septal ring factor EnvC (AmiA/AmiB activator)